jgi:alpha-L-rhamnosidase
MKNFILPLFVVICFFSCQNTPSGDEAVHWGEARWIALEKLEDSLKIVPAVHGWGDNLGEKGAKRSVVPMFRKTFSLEKPVKSAVIHLSGLGHYELSVNGEKIGDRFLSPGWTLYPKRILFNTYDITQNLQSRENALGVLVGNGFYNVNRERYRKLVVAHGYPKLIFSIEIQFGDGTETRIVSDENCRVASSPITFSSIYGGEDYDATLEQPGWNTPGFNDSNWQKPIILEDGTENLIFR